MRSAPVCFLLLAPEILGRKQTATTTVKPTAVIDPLKHDILILNERNFNSGITKFRDRFPAAVLYHNGEEDADLPEFIEGQWNNYARQMKGLARLGAVDCLEFPAICKREIGEASPSKGSREIMIYPPLPLPAYKFEDAPSKLSSRLLKLLPPATITELTDEASLALFFNQAPGIPKVVLFTDKKRIAPLYHGLAHNLGDRMNFGIVKEASLASELATRMRVKKIPTLILKKGAIGLNLKGVSVYPKSEMTYEAIHEWLNIHSETFVKGGGFVDDSDLALPTDQSARPWRNDKLPQLTKASHNDLCFKKPSGLCAIYLRGDQELQETEIAMIETIRNHFLTKPGSPEFYWSWMNMTEESSFAKLFQLYGDNDELDHSKLPTFAIFNPHKRLRFTTLEGEMNSQNAIDFIDRIIAGDGRFKALKGNTLPGFRVQQKSKSKDEL